MNIKYDIKIYMVPIYNLNSNIHKTYLNFVIKSLYCKAMITRLFI